MPGASAARETPMYDNEFRVDMREVLARRRRMQRQRRLRRTLFVAACLALLTVLFFFSPWGPGKNLFFGRESEGKELAGEAHPSDGGGSGEGIALPGDEGGGEGACAAGQGCVFHAAFVSADLEPE